MISIIPIAHRGFWAAPAEQNQLVAFRRAFEHGFGIETDLRDVEGRLVVSHDPATRDCLEAEALFELYRACGATAPLALNIKSDGLQALLADALGRYGIESYFVFDMSVPELRRYLDRSFHCFTRQSEYESQPALYERSEGVWVDQFTSDWVGSDTLQRHLDRSKSACVVSPELHGRDPRAFWASLREGPAWMGSTGAKVMLCTDAPDRAEAFFRS